MSAMVSVQSSFRALRARVGFGPAQRADLYDMVAGLVEDGKPLFDALSDMHKQFTREGHPGAIVLASVLRAMRGSSGRAITVGQALAPWVDPVEAMTIDAGAQVGRVADGFRMAKRLCETTGRVRKTIRSEMLYPAALVLVFLAFLGGVGALLLPMLTEVLPRHQWPRSAQAMGWLGDHAIALSVTLVAIIGSLLGAFALSRDNWVGPMRDRFDRLVFPWSLACTIKGALLLSTISIMLKAGTPFDTILSQLRSTAGDWERNHLDRMRSNLRAGWHAGDALAGSMYSGRIRWQIEIYGQMSNFAESIDRLSHRVVEQVIQKVKSTFLVIGNVVIVVITGMAIWTYGTFMDITLAVRSAQSF